MTMLRNCLLLTALLLAFGSATVTVSADDTKPATDQTSGGSGSPYLAQMPGEHGSGPGGPMHGPFGGPGQQRKHLEELRILKMLELLNLTSEQEIPFLTLFNQFRLEQRALEEKSELLLDSMAAELALANPKETRLKDLVGRVKAIEMQRFEKFTALVDRVESLLSVQQVAKLMIFQKRFEMELLEQIGRFRRGPDGPTDSTDFQKP